MRPTLGDERALREGLTIMVSKFLPAEFAESGAGSSAQNSVVESYQTNYEPYTPLFIPEPIPVPEPDAEIYNN